MSQHIQLAAGSGIVPADGQVGDAFSGPARFEPYRGAMPRRVATVGIEPSGFLRRAILWRVFGPADVEALTPEACFAAPPPAAAVVIKCLPDPPSWAQLLDWAGDRTVVIDVEIAAAMAAVGGHSLRTGITCGAATPTLAVMCHQHDRQLYPNAPVAEIIADPPVPCGLAVGDRVHLYVPSTSNLGLRVLSAGPELDRFVAAVGATIWAREPLSRGAALLSCPTPRGGCITIMDLHTVERVPNADGSETLAIQILLSLLGRSPVTFGRFVVPPANYSELSAQLAALVQRHPRFASLETIGHSVEGKELLMVKIARRPGLPAVLLTNMMHPYEWAPTFGVLGYLRFLLDRLETGGFEADELLGQHQVWWVPCICPDGYANRCQQPSAINLIHNFPDGWSYAAAGHPRWGAYGQGNSLQTISPISWPGPAPASQPETRALMALLNRPDGAVATVVDFHENVSQRNFLHQVETLNGELRHLDYHAELTEGIRQAFLGRFYEYREGSRAGDGSFDVVGHEETFAPGWESSWQIHAMARGAKAVLVEAAGGDCTHYRTIRRTEHAAQMAEQVLAAELGRLIRNPWGEDRSVTVNPRRGLTSVLCRIFDRDGKLVEESIEPCTGNPLSRVVPAGGCLRLRYDIQPK